MSQPVKRVIDLMDDFLQKQENNIINETVALRLEIVDNFIKENGLPTKARDIETINKVLDSVDKNIYDRVDRRLKQEENKTNEELLEMVKELVINVEKKKLEQPILEPEQIEIDIELKDDEIVPGEDVIEYQELNPDEFMK
jgi:methyl coenzyme M reductase beta subunit